MVTVTIFLFFFFRFRPAQAIRPEADVGELAALRSLADVLALVPGAGTVGHDD